jgi:hypothetical protein
MAASCLDIITYAMRQARVIGPGKEPKDAEAEEGLAALQSFYDELLSGGMFGRLEDTLSDRRRRRGRGQALPTGVGRHADRRDHDCRFEDGGHAPF